MRSPLARGLIALGAVAVVVVLFIVLAGGDDESSNNGTTAATQTTTTRETTTTQTTTVPAPEEITVRNGKPVGGVKDLEYTSGERVRFVVRSDVADEVHVHGYDISEQLPAGGAARLSFPARLEGVFEIELHDVGEQIAELRVNP